VAGTGGGVEGLAASWPRTAAVPGLVGAPGSHHDIQISGTASDLALFLWQRAVPGKLDVQGDTSLIGRYFALVPPL
jgi:hypothetical protein